MKRDLAIELTDDVLHVLFDNADSIWFYEFKKKEFSWIKSGETYDIKFIGHNDDNIDTTEFYDIFYYLIEDNMLVNQSTIIFYDKERYYQGQLTFFKEIRKLINRETILNQLLE